LTTLLLQGGAKNPGRWLLLVRKVQRISQDSVATRDGIFSHYCKFTADCDSKRIFWKSVRIRRRVSVQWHLFGVQWPMTQF